LFTGRILPQSGQADNSAFGGGYGRMLTTHPAGVIIRQVLREAAIDL
jgi:hypothetical protein